VGSDRGPERDAQPVHRPAPRHDDRGRRRSDRLQPRLFGQLPRPRSTCSTTRVRSISPTISADVEPGAPSPPRRPSWSTHDRPGDERCPHGLYRERLACGTRRDAPRPVLINNWEATSFGFDEANCSVSWLGARPRRRAVRARRLVRRAIQTTHRWVTGSSIGVLPDGSTARRQVEASSPVRLIEPEMVSQRSRLRGTPGLGRRRPAAAHRESPALVLDLSRPEVVDHLFGVLSEVLRAPISYVKWDMNRTITEPFSPALPADRQGEFFHATCSASTTCTPADSGLPEHPVRVVRQRRRPVRPGHAGLRATGLDQR
jgi:hypothetical protein